MENCPEIESGAGGGGGNLSQSVHPTPTHSRTHGTY